MYLVLLGGLLCLAKLNADDEAAGRVTASAEVPWGRKRRDSKVDRERL